MKTHFSTFSALVTLLLAISPTNAWTPPIAWTPNIIFQDEQVQNVDLCALYVEVPGWCDGKAIINHDLCMNSNGRRSVEACGGLLTVDFPPETNETTPVHFSAANGSWVGGTSPNKISGNNASMTEIDMDAGTAQWGNANYVGGWCVAHIVQYQKLDPSAAVTKEMAQYSYNISLYDNSPTRQYIGGTSELLFVEDKATQGIDSALPSVFEITSGCESLSLVNK